MHNPPHPGLTLRDDVLPALGMNVTDAAQALAMQAAYDLWAAEQKAKKGICKIKPQRPWWTSWQVHSSYIVCLCKFHIQSML
jgi:plasmid maintenance system antidote protein VapI